MVVTFVIIGSIAVTTAIAWVVLRRFERDVAYERKYREPPALGGGPWPNP